MKKKEVSLSTQRQEIQNFRHGVAKRPSRELKTVPGTGAPTEGERMAGASRIGLLSQSEVDALKAGIKIGERIGEKIGEKHAEQERIKLNVMVIESCSKKGRK